MIPTCLVPLDSYNSLLPNNTKQVPICPNIKELWLHYKARPLKNLLRIWVVRIGENYAFTLIFCTMCVFDSYLWPSATKWGSLTGVSKLRKVYHCNKHHFLHILMQKLLLNDFPIKSYRMLNITSMLSFKITYRDLGCQRL